MPFFNSTVVMVAVVIFSSVAMSSGDRAASSGLEEFQQEANVT
jgi:hypothetical protein